MPIDQYLSIFADYHLYNEVTKAEVVEVCDFFRRLEQDLVLPEILLLAIVKNIKTSGLVGTTHSLILKNGSEIDTLRSLIAYLFVYGAQAADSRLFFQVVNILLKKGYFFRDVDNLCLAVSNFNNNSAISYTLAQEVLHRLIPDWVETETTAPAPDRQDKSLGKSRILL